MYSRDLTRTYQVLWGGGEEWASASLELIAEEPLLIRIDEKPYSVVMRTPGEERCHAIGFCLGEGIIDSTDDLVAVRYDEVWDHNVVDVRLQPERRQKIPGVLQRESFLSQTSCGICGKRMIDDIYQDVRPAENGFALDVPRVFECLQMFSRKQKHYRTSRGSHAALILGERLEPIAMAEDVGRHNALDKAVGKAMMEGRLADARILVLSSRTSHELVQKAARGRLQMIISHSRPTTLALEMAQALNMTLVFPNTGSELVIVCGEERIRSRGSVRVAQI